MLSEGFTRAEESRQVSKEGQRKDPSTRLRLGRPLMPPLVGEVAKISDFGRRGASPVTDKFRHPQSKCPHSSAILPARCGEPGRGSDSPPGCHSLPRLRFAYPLQGRPFTVRNGQARSLQLAMTGFSIRYGPAAKLAFCNRPNQISGNACRG